MRNTPSTLATGARLAAVLLLLTLGRPAVAGTVYTWASPVSGPADWAGNWSPGGIPDAGSYLIYDKPGDYTVGFYNTTPQTWWQEVRAGSVSLSMSSPHVTEKLTVGYNSQLTLTAGSIVGPTAFGAYVQLGSGPGVSGFTLTNGSQFTGRADVGYNSEYAQLYVNQGARFQVPTYGELAIRERGVMWLWGSIFVDPDRRYSSLVLDPGATLKMGGYLAANNGAFVDAGGPVWITGGSTAYSIQSMHIGPALGDDRSYLNARNELIVGKKFGAASNPFIGSAELNVYDRSWVHVAGATQVGDSVSDNGCMIRLYEGATFTADGPLRVFTTVGAGLDLRGGIVHLRGGPFRWPANKTLFVSSRVGTPELWITNGQANTGPNTGSFLSQLIVGRGGFGTLRVTRPGTSLTLGAGATSVGDSLGGVGTIVVDSLAAIVSGGQLVVGSAGYGRLQVMNGSSVSGGTMSIGAAPTGNGGVLVTGTGSTLTARDNVWVGGGFGGDATTGSLEIDAGAVVNVLQTGINPPAVTVYPTAGVLAVANGGTLAIAGGGVFNQGSVALRGGTIQSFVSNAPAGRVNGRGLIAGNLINSGAVVPTADGNDFGRLRVGGNFMQFAAGHYRVDLGSGLRSDTLDVTGAATLAGTLDLRLASGFVRTPGDTFTVLLCGSRTGTFETVTWQGNPLGTQALVVYEPNAVKVVITSSNVDVETPVDPLPGLRFAPLAVRGGLSFQLDLPVAADVTVGLYDVSGREVERLADGAFAAGRHRFTAGAGRIPSGMYFARAVVRARGVALQRTARGMLIR